MDPAGEDKARAATRVLIYACCLPGKVSKNEKTRAMFKDLITKAVGAFQYMLMPAPECTVFTIIHA